MSALLRNITQSLFQLQLSSTRVLVVPSRQSNRYPSTPKLRNPYWFARNKRVVHNDNLTRDNQAFLKEVVADRYGTTTIIKGRETYQNPVPESILRQEFEVPAGEWGPYVKRSGAIARKIGVYPLWTKKGERVLSTMLMISENYVIKYSPPGEYDVAMEPRRMKYDKLGLLLVGSESVDPSTCTKEYCGIFDKAGVMPTRYLNRFFVTPTAALQPGTPINATHYRVGQTIDVKANTIDRGFQGVIKRWGFKGMPATHGQTKTHRRPGNIGTSGMARVWPGKKMPGHMGNRWRMMRGIRILRINHEHNVLFVLGCSIPGEINSFCQINDTVLPLRKPQEPLPFPTDFSKCDDDVWADDMHDFRDPTITFIEQQ